MYMHMYAYVYAYRYVYAYVYIGREEGLEKDVVENVKQTDYMYSLIHFQTI